MPIGYKMVLLTRMLDRNGVLHVGHAFSDSKIEFMAGWERMQGKRVLWPQGYHCTGLPIKASADKIANEVKMFGQEFENYNEDTEITVEKPDGKENTVQAKNEDVTKFKATKGKANAKTVKAKYQFQIMESVGIPRNEIHRFADANYWLEFFPPLCKRDLSALGCRIDWRRQFVTTDANPYYDGEYLLVLAPRRVLLFSANVRFLSIRQVANDSSQGARQDQVRKAIHDLLCQGWPALYGPRPE